MTCQAEIDEQPEFPTVNGRLTTSFAMKAKFQGVSNSCLLLLKLQEEQPPWQPSSYTWGVWTWPQVIGDQAPYTAGPGTPGGAFRQGGVT